MNPTQAGHAATTGRPRRDRRRRFATMICAVLLAGGSATRTAAVDAAPEALTFDTYEVELGPVEHPTILPGSFLGGAAVQLAVVRPDPGGVPRVRLYGLDAGTWSPALDAALRSGVRFVDVATIAGRDRLIVYEDDGLSWFDPASATLRPLVELTTSYRATEGRGIPHLDVTPDLNGDGRDDLLLPDVDGFWVATQSGDGVFSEPAKLGPPEPFAGQSIGGLDVDRSGPDGPRTYGDVGISAATLPWYLSRVHQMDHDLDGRNDLAFWTGEHFDVHHQDERGRFDPVAEAVPVDVPFEADGVYARAFDFRDQGLGALIFGLGKSTRRTVLHSLQDVDGDGIADLVTLTLEGPSLTRQRSVYEVHFGEPAAGGIVFARRAGSEIRPSGRAGGLEPWGYARQRFEDLDADGRPEFLYGYVPVGLGGMLRAMVGNTVPIDLELYRTDDGVYPEEPTMRRKIRRFAPFAGLGNVFTPPVLLGDLDGDGRADLVVGRSPRELHVHLGRPAPDLLAREALKVAVDLPYDERRIRLVDLDGDGRQDVLIHLGPTGHKPDQPHRLTMLVAR